MTSSKTPKASRSGRVGKGGAKLLAVCVVALTMVGCKHTDDPTRVAGWTLIDPAQRHPILVSQEPTDHFIHVANGSIGLTPAQRAKLIDFVNRYRATDAGNSRLVVSVPSGAANEVSAMNSVLEVRNLLADYGFSESSISVEAYEAEGAGQPPIRVSYLRYVAQPPECGDWSTNLAYEPTNLPYPNFGCATQRNFGAQIANPADLLGPRSMTARSSERRDQVWSKYIRGEPTAARRTKDDAVDTESN